MRPIASKRVRKGAVAVVALVGALVLGACSTSAPAENLAVQDVDEERTVNFFSPMEKISPDTENTARTASDLTIAMAEERLGLTLAYHTYTAENYQDKTYDEVCLERARNNSDDLYLLNTDAIVTLGSEGHLADLSGLSCAQNLREVVRAANTVDGKLVAIPQEVVAYGLFVNKDIFDECELSLPNTPEEFLECCRVLKEKGYETPVGANRWWLETFVFAVYAWRLHGRRRRGRRGAGFERGPRPLQRLHASRIRVLEEADRSRLRRRRERAGERGLRRGRRGR